MSCVSLRLFAPALVFTDVAGVDISLLGAVDVDVGIDIGRASVMGVDIGVMGVVVTDVVCVEVLLRVGVFLFVVLTDVGVFFLLARFVCLVDGSSSFRSWGSCLV